MGHHYTQPSQNSRNFGSTSSITGASRTMESLMLVSCSIRNGMGTSGFTKGGKTICDLSFFHFYRANLNDPAG